MSLQMCSKFQLKEVKVGDDDGDEIGESAAGVMSNFLKKIGNDDIFYEILVRIPNCRSAIVCSSVSRRWNALISHPRFARSFTSHHQQHRDRYPPPCTVIFRKSEQSTSAFVFQPICTLFSEESAFLHFGKSTKSPKCVLDFLPSPPTIVRASCDDLLLLSRGNRCLEYEFHFFGDALVPATPRNRCPTVFYVCNPVTEQIYRLPDLPKQIEMCGYALARMPESECHFKVVLFHMSCPPHRGQRTPDPESLNIYCSKLGKWENKRFMHPQPRTFVRNFSLDVFVCNGNLYWLELERGSKRVLSFHLWGTRRGCSAIDFPDDFWWFRSTKIAWHMREQIGTVGGELRLVQVVLTKNKFVDFKVWRLFDTSSSSPSSLWVLVHDKKYSTRPSEEEFVAAFVHPTDGDMVLMVWGKSVYRYNLTMEEDTYEKMAELQEPLNLKTGALETKDRLMFFPVVHPPWPTPLPLQEIKNQK